MDQMQGKIVWKARAMFWWFQLPIYLSSPAWLTGVIFQSSQNFRYKAYPVTWLKTDLFQLSYKHKKKIRLVKRTSPFHGASSPHINWPSPLIQAGFLYHKGHFSSKNALTEMHSTFMKQSPGLNPSLPSLLVATLYTKGGRGEGGRPDSHCYLINRSSHEREIL